MSADARIAIKSTVGSVGNSKSAMPVKSNFACLAAEKKRPAGNTSPVKSAKRAHAMEFIEKMPDGINSIIGDNGLKFSGGQRQRLAIARAFLKDAPILIMDEATSALDTESERLVQVALENMMKNKDDFNMSLDSRYRFWPISSEISLRALSERSQKASLASLALGQSNFIPGFRIEATNCP